MNLKAFVKNSSIIMTTTLISGIFGFAFHPLVARFISVKEFAELQALLSLSIILAVPASTLALIISRYSSKFYAKRDLAKIKELTLYFTKKVMLWSLLLLLLFLLASPWVGGYLKIHSFTLMLLTGLIMVFSIIGGIFGPLLQGMQKFVALGSLGVISAFLRLAFGVGLVLLVNTIYGVMNGILLGSIFTALISFWVLWRYLKKVDLKKTQTTFKVKDYGYYANTFFITLFLAAFHSVDVILVKNIFTVQEAGFYVAAAVLAKAIIIAGGALENVMFPVVVEKYESNNHPLAFFLQSVGILTAGLLFSVGVFYFFGDYFILLMGAKYADAGPYIWKIGILASLFSLIHYLIKFFLAIKKTSFVYLLGLGSVLQVLFGYIFSANLNAFIWGMSYAMVAVLLMLTVYLIFQRKTLLPREADLI